MFRPKRSSELRRPITASTAERRLITHNHPWTNGWIKRMNRTIKEKLKSGGTIMTPTSKLHEPLKNFLNAYNFAKRLHKCGVYCS